MTKQITVIGLDQPGASLGLALAEFKQSLIRVGHDADGSRVYGPYRPRQQRSSL